MELRTYPGFEFDLTVDNVAYFYEYSSRRHKKDQTNICLSFLDANASKLFQCSRALRAIPRPLMITLLQRDTFFANEADIFNALMIWRVRQRKPRISKLLKHIRWNLVTPFEFDKYVLPTRLMSKDDYMHLKQIAKPNRLPPKFDLQPSKAEIVESVQAEVVVSECKNDKENVCGNGVVTSDTMVVDEEIDLCSSSASEAEHIEVLNLASDEDVGGVEEVNGNDSPIPGRISGTTVEVVEDNTERVNYLCFDKPFGCDMCSKRYRRERELNDHLRAHEDNFTCADCGKSGFTLKSSIVRHKEEGRCDLQVMKNKYLTERRRTGEKFVSNFMSFISRVDSDNDNDTDC